MCAARSLLASAFLLALAGSAAADVLVVDDDGGPGVYTTIGAAVAAAADGDTILVKTADYSETVVIDGKGLVLIEDAGEVATFFVSEIEVKNLASHQEVVLRGFDGYADLDLTDNAGTVWIEECLLATLSGAPGVAATGSQNVVIIRSQIAGSSSTLFTTGAAPGIDAVDSNVHLYGSDIYGGGFGGQHTQGAVGLAAVRMDGGLLFASGCQLTGGSGSGFGSGHASALELTGVTTRLLDCDLIPGSTSLPDIEQTGGTVGFLPKLHRAFQVSAPVRFGGPITITFHGNEGDQVWLPHDFDPAAIYLLNFHGTWLIDPVGFNIHFLGALPATGELILNLTTPSVTGVPAVPFYIQGVFVEPGGDIVMGDGSLTVLLDPSL